MQHTHARRGRPPTGRSPILTLALPGPMLAAIDALAAGEFVARAVAVRQLLELGLAHHPATAAQTPAQGRGTAGARHG